jgi:hypothetical protein
MHRAYRPKPKYAYLLFTRDERRRAWIYHSTISTEKTAERLCADLAKHGTTAKIQRKRV